MKIADLYIRVSTDEQADKGYSQRSQEEMLRKYCDIHNIQIRKVIFEDYSAKSFNRPAWTKLLISLKKEKGKSDLILFTKWDRFSRNAGDAYQMISHLRKLGVEPQAIEQPLDLSIPENKMMLAFYLAAPEVENDRRALNTFFGMRRAKKEGRYMGSAPVGYINKTTEAGKKYIAPFEPQASIMRWVFSELADGLYNAEQIYKQAKEKGLKCTKSSFWMNIRNPLYCGKIFIPKFKDEEAHFVKGQHEPLITEGLFYKVQDVLDGRKRCYRLKVVADAVLPLRGFLICLHCCKALTGSKSKGHGGVYYYYHCYKGCKCRFRAENVNRIFIQELRKYNPRPEFIPLYKRVLTHSFQSMTGPLQAEKNVILEQIKQIEQNLAHTRTLLSTQKIEAEDYYAIKKECSVRLERLEAQLAEIPAESKDIDGLLQQGIENLLAVDKVFEGGTIEQQRKIIGSMYPEKLSFDGFSVRTSRVNAAAQLIYSLGAGFGGNKKGQNGGISTLSCEVTLSGFKPETF